VENGQLFQLLNAPKLVGSYMFGWLNPHRRTAEPAWDSDAFGEASRGLFWEADSVWRHYRRLHRIWTVFHYLAGGTSVTLAAVSGFGGLSEILDPQPAAIVALASAVVGALATFFGGDKRREESAGMAAAWDSFRDDISITQLKRGKSEDPQRDDGWDDIISVYQGHARHLRARKADSDLDIPKWRR